MSLFIYVCMYCFVRQFLHLCVVRSVFMYFVTWLCDWLFITSLFVYFSWSLSLSLLLLWLWLLLLLWFVLVGYVCRCSFLFVMSLLFYHVAYLFMYFILCLSLFPLSRCTCNHNDVNICVCIVCINTNSRWCPITYDSLLPYICLPEVCFVYLPATLHGSSAIGHCICCAQIFMIC